MNGLPEKQEKETIRSYRKTKPKQMGRKMSQLRYKIQSCPLNWELYGALFYHFVKIYSNKDIEICKAKFLEMSYRYGTRFQWTPL